MEALEPWHDYFVAQAGASAALAGLLFVALSINIERILKQAWLPPRAGVTMLLLVGSVVEALLGLWPHQTLRTAGVEEVVVAFVTWAFTLHLTRAQSQTPVAYRRGTILSALIVQAAALPALGGATCMGMGIEGGIYAVAFSALMAIVVGFLNSWVLLVEILR